MSSDRIKQHLDAYIRRLVAPIDWQAAYACKVVKQNDDGTLELRPEDKRLNDFQKVPVHYGIPDTKATFSAGARVMLEFENGDRAAPYVSCFDFATISLLDIGGRGGTTQFAALANLVNDGFTKVHDAMNAGFSDVRSTNLSLTTHAHAFTGTGVVGLPTGLTTSDPSDMDAVGDVSAATVKIR